MMLKLKYPALLIILSFLLGACQKEYTFDENTTGTTGSFTFAGAPGACVSATVTGTYTAGTVLNAGNAVTVSVDVATAGAYTVSTSAVNGISFSGSGIFTSAGIQTISLTGTGMPAAAGTFSFTIGSNGCTFPVTFAGGGTPTSVFIFSAAQGACTDGKQAGNYLTGTALTASNTVTVDVNVSKAGTWSIATSVVDGFAFSGNGSFTSTGVQQVTLTGAGTPTADGLFEFAPPTSGCAFHILVGPGTAGSEEYYYEATVDGTAYKETVTETNGYIAGSSLGGVDDVIVASNISPSALPIPANQTSLAIGKGILHNYTSASNATFKSFFTPGKYPYAASSAADGVGIEWIDGSSNSWSTDNPPGTQTGSVFTIISVEDRPAINGYYIKVTATFNCTIYDLNGNAKTLTKGKYIGLFGKI